jgi:gluconolactonase
MGARELTLAFLTSTLSLMVPQNATAQNVAAQAPPYGRPDATVDLRTREGAELVKGIWHYSDVKIVEADFRAPGPDLKPSGKPIKTYDYTPHAGAAAFDDSKWEALDPTTLEARRSGGKLCFNWYRRHRKTSQVRRKS